MRRVLILSSYVAASRVGGGVQALALARLGIEPILVPTTLFGRHPGYGPPGGAAVSAETFEAVLGGVEAQGLLGQLDAVITGYFSSSEQVAAAARAIDRVRSIRPKARIVVDPILGDEAGGLYVRAAVADSLAADLVGRADVLTPNAWELGWLTKSAADDLEVAARSLGRPVLLTSAPVAEGMAVAYYERGQSWRVTHPAAPSAPKGTGDLLTALFTAGLIADLGPQGAMAAAVSGVVEAVFAADGEVELPVAAMPSCLAVSDRVRLERLDG